MMRAMPSCGLACAMLFAHGCYRGFAGADDGASADDDGTAGPEGGTVDDDGDGTGDDTGEPAECQGVQVGTTPLRRLTREQYANAARDLFGVEAEVAALEGDEKIGPFDSNISTPVSPGSVNQLRALAEDVAEAAVLDLPALLACDPVTDATCLDGFVRELGRRAYRRPLEDDEVARLLALADLGDDATADVRLVIQALLQSPHFLYQLEFGLPDPDADVVALAGPELATRLSFFLWNSIPDDELLDAAAAGELDTPEGLRAQAERMLAHPNARDAVASFHVQWLGADELALAGKDPVVYPLFTEELRAAMAKETREFASAVVLDGDAKLDTLLGASYSYLEGPLFELYGVTMPPGHDPSEPVELDPNERAGLLTHASFLATHAHANQSGPIQRGVVVRSNLLCSPPPPPPPDINVVPPDPDPNQTTREIFEEHTADPTCAACHELIDGIGLGFEGYDGIGAYREFQNDLPVDQSGEVVGTDVAGPFVGAVELAHKLAESEEVRGCVATQWFRFAFGRIEGDADTCTLDALKAYFAESDHDVRALLIALVQTEAFRYRAVSP